jgi:hypothetical protein
LIRLALEQAEAEAAAQQQPKKPDSPTPESKHD